MTEESSPERRIIRVRFEGDAASIQIRLTAVLLMMQRHFEQAWRRGNWSGEHAKAAAEMAGHFRCLAEEWQALEPPDVLRGGWEALSGALQAFGPLWERVVRLSDETGPSLMHRLTELERDFTSGIEKANSLEKSLLEKEKDLAQS